MRCGGTNTGTKGNGDGLYARALAIDSNNILYAGTDAGLFISADGGSTWSAADPSIPAVFIRAIAVGADNTVYVASSAGMFRSAGAGWLAINTGLASINSRNIAVDRNGLLYATSFDVKQGLQPDGKGGFEPAPPVYTGGMYKSLDGGAHWLAVQNKLVAQFNVDSFAINNTGTVYAKYNSLAYRSRDGGANWTLLGSFTVYSLGVDKMGTLYAGTDGGASYSVNDGDTWLPVNIGLNGVIVNLLSSDATGTIYAGTSDSNVYQFRNQPVMQISAVETGPNTALQLMGQIQVAPSDVGQTGKLYVAALLPNGTLFFLGSQGWVPLSNGTLPAYASVSLGTHTLPILNGSVNLAGLVGTTLFAGYGLTQADMITNGKFRQIYVIY